MMDGLFAADMRLLGHHRQAEEPMRQLLQDVQCDRHTQGLEQLSHGHIIIQTEVIIHSLECQNQQQSARNNS